jgi:hypothetical protein
MFTTNKYTRWYYDIVDRAKERSLSTYTEKHHIIPKSLGGNNSVENLVELTAREHFICHWLLVKIYPVGDEHWKMLNAFRMMRTENPVQQRYKTKITGRVYANLKEEYSILQSKKVSGKKPLSLLKTGYLKILSTSGDFVQLNLEST